MMMMIIIIIIIIMLEFSRKSNTFLYVIFPTLSQTDGDSMAVRLKNTQQ